MLKIAVIANDYAECRRFIQWKFKDHIDHINEFKGVFILKNGDELYMCYDEGNKLSYISMSYDAFIVSEHYKSLLDVIIYRASRPS